MPILTCTECGNTYSDLNTTCPQCGAPRTNLPQNNVGQTPAANQYGSTVEPNQPTTTDTGYENEKVLNTYANVIFVIMCVIAGLTFIAGIASFVAMTNNSYVNVGASIASFFGMFLVPLVIYLLAFVVRAFIRVYTNISTNLHEMNMKMKS